VSYVLFLQFFPLGFYGVLGHMHLAALGQGGVLRNLSWARKAYVAHMPETLVLSINREEIPISCNLWRAAPYSNKESVPLYTLVSLCSTIIQLSRPWTTPGSKGFLTHGTPPRSLAHSVVLCTCVWGSRTRTARTYGGAFVWLRIYFGLPEGGPALRHCIGFWGGGRCWKSEFARGRQ
jgi:hypothetical protein